jgi:hypothetical protein
MKVRGKVRALGNTYVDGLERLEIHVKKDEGQELPNQDGQRVPITLVIEGQSYRAGLRSTSECSYIWVSPNLIDENNQEVKLAHILHEVGVQKNHGQIIATFV